MQLDVPLVNEARIGDNWGELESLIDTLFEALENTTE
jgi:hypothetical protein